MPAEFHKPLFERARARGLLPFTTLYDPRDLSFTEELGNPIYKIASFELTHYELLAEVAGTGKPVILSTGMSDLAEIEEALGVLDKHEAGPVVLMHCCSAYPAEPAEANLNAIATMKAAFQLPVGYSDHTVGPHIPLAAVMRGACVIEKHVTNDVHRRGPDHRFSADAATMTQMVRFIRESEAALGSGRKTAQPSEMINRAAGRRSIFVVKDIKAGQRIDRDCLRVVRPGAGLHPRYLGRMLGGRAARDLKAGSPLEWDDIVCR
jgi:N-acetylneuraminate synthase